MTQALSPTRRRDRRDIRVVVGALAMAVFLWHAGLIANQSPTIPADDDGGRPIVAVRPSARETPPQVAPPPQPPPAATPVVGASPIEDLRARHLQLPLDVKPDALRDSFDEERGSRASTKPSTSSRRAIRPSLPRTALLPSSSPARPAASPSISSDPTTTYVYYYAHLERYAPGLIEGGRLRRGQVIGFVGTSGNAPKDTPHLHFSIFKLTEKKRWWEGAAIDPYEVLK
jgi:hypothetical protein